ncbi:hypothetical protein M1146_06620 [Patescibacteria group bacterium]|nr:hypothetical protein [Patescibacteria group bacterium]
MKELQKRLDEENKGNSILAVSCTPGMTQTPLMDAFFAKTWQVSKKNNT